MSAPCDWANISRFADCSQARIIDRDPREERMIKMERHLTNDMHRPNHWFRSMLEHSSAVKWFMKVLGVLGVGLLLAGKSYVHNNRVEMYIDACRWYFDPRPISSGCYPRVSVLGQH